MKVKHLFLAAAAAIFTFAACQEKIEDLGEPNIDLSTATLNFEQGANSQTITLNSTRDWKATDVADWIVVEPASGKAAKEDQTIAITVLENTDMNRTCSIKFTCGIDSEYLTVNQAGPGGGVEEGDGTLEHPYIASQARAVASALDADVPTTDFYYIKGFVSKIASIDTGTYGNANFYITDTKDGGDEDFYCFQVMYLNGAKFTSADQLKEGDEVVVKAQLVNYKGNTPETVGKGSGKLISINGQGGSGDDSGDDGGDDTGGSGTPSGDGTQASPYNATAAYQAAKALAADTPTSDYYYIKGFVKRIASIDTGTYGNANFYITDTKEGNTEQFYCFQVMYLDGAKFTSADQLKEGDEVIVKAQLVNYKGNTPETVGKGSGRLISINGQGGSGDDSGDDGGEGGGDGVDPSTLSQITCAEFNALSSSDENYYILEGDVTTVENTQYGNLYIKDASGEEAYIYGLNGQNGEAFGTLDVAKGDKIKIYGKHFIYNNTTVEMKEAKLLSLTKGQGGDDGSTGEAVVTLTFPDDNSASNKVNGYDKPWTAKSGSYSFTMTAFNNYEWNNWSYVRCGRKQASVASIATNEAIGEAVSKIVIAIDKITASDVNSISLIVAEDSAFSNVVETVAVSAERGDVEAAISSPEAGLFYKLVFDCKASSENKNGFVQVSSLKFMK